MDLTLEHTSRIKHSFRNGYYTDGVKVADEALKKFPNESLLKIYKATGLFKMRKNNEAIRILDPLTGMSLAASVAAIEAHKACVHVDREAIATLEANVRDGMNRASPEELCYIGEFYSLIGSWEKARVNLEKAIKQGFPSPDLLCARGWVELQLPVKERGSKTAQEYFETVLKEHRRHLDALLGLAQYYEQNSRFGVAVDKLNLALATVPDWSPALVDKMNIVLAESDWEQATDLANRILGLENNLEARRLKILHVLCREGNIDLVTTMLTDFLGSCQQLEGQNADYFVENSRMFSQLGSFSPPILGVCLRFAKAAVELDFDNAGYVTEVGRLHALLGEVKEARQEFKTATDMDKTSASALVGLISCQLAEGSVGDAAQQLEFVREISSKSPEVLYLSAVVARETGSSSEVIIKFLGEAVECHFASMRGFPFNMKYLKLVDADLVLKIAKEYLKFVPPDPPTNNVLPAPVKQAAFLLEPIMKVCPCHRDALFINAQVQNLSGDFRSAVGTLDQLTKIDPSLQEVHLLLAQIHLSRGEVDSAFTALQAGMSANFKIREHPKYQFLMAKIQRSRGDVKTALKTLNEALTMVKSSGDQTPTHAFSQTDKMLVYMELMSMYRQQGNFDTANGLMQEALIEFKGTQLEGRLGLTQAEELVDKGEYDKAISLLRSVKPEQSHFIDSRKLLADIYFNYRSNNEQYINCFTEIVNSNPIPANLIMLADAYMYIQEPEKGVEIYEIALAKNPRDPVLASKMGQALVLNHQYTKAVNYYKEAVRNDDNFSLRLDLASLLLKLKQWDKAEKTVTQALSDIKGNTLANLTLEVKFLILLAKISQGNGNSSQAQSSLVRAKDVQGRVLKRVVHEAPTTEDEQKATFCTITQLLGDIAERPSDIEFAIRSLKEGLELCPDEWQCLIVLAKQYMKMGDKLHCQQTCQQLLSVKKDCAEASLMLGELYFRKAEFQSSSFHFQQFLDRNPMNWKALSWFIECGRRMGNLAEAHVYLAKAIALSDSNDPGEGYCTGLFEYYSGNSNAALKMFNKARKDPVHGTKSLLAMIDIYLNPTGNVLGGDALETSGTSDILANGTTRQDYRDVTLSTAETLIQELNPRTQDDKFRKHILENIVLIVSKNKAKVEKATQELAGRTTTDPGKDPSVMLIYALATGYMVAKQVPKARNQLKRVTKNNWTVDDADYLERCWLLLSDIYIQGSKFDLASELIKRVLQYNKSCYKANEYLGHINEKEQAYADAASNYDAAWKLTNLSNPAMGYKLAFNYLKAKRYTDAIDVCHIVMEKYPTYPKIKKEILDKARANLRP